MSVPGRYARSEARQDMPTVAVSVLSLILISEKNQRRTAAIELFVHLRIVGQQLRRIVVESSRRKQSPLQLSLVRDRGNAARVPL